MKQGPVGPVPVWADKDAEVSVEEWVFESARDQLVYVLQERIRRLEEGDKEAVFAEAKKELAAQMVEGSLHGMHLILGLIEELTATCST